MPRVFLASYDDDALADLAQRIIAGEAKRLPDLTHVIVLLPDNLAAARLRALLLAQVQQNFNQQGLLGPTIQSLPEWVARAIAPTRHVLGRDARELLLAQTVAQHATFFGHANPWALADALLDFFDDLTLHRVTVSKKFDDFLAQIIRAYGPASSYNEALGVEARVIHTLWIAWHEQLAAHDLIDPSIDYVDRLTRLRQSDDSHRHYYAAGFIALSPPERDWLKQLLDINRLTLVLHGQAQAKPLHPDAPLANLARQLSLQLPMAETTSPYSAFLDRVFDDGAVPLSDRALQQRNAEAGSPLRNRLRTLSAHGFDDEARAIDIQTRRWLVQGVHPVGLVIEDRQLARRVRALLERAGMTVVDRAGWALSTTAAAAAVETWLQTLEEDFAYRPLLDTLKSPFAFPDTDHASHLQHVYRLHNDIIVNENIARGLDRYRRATRARAHRLSTGDGSGAAGILGLLDALEHAGAPLNALRQQGVGRPTHYVHALRQSLERLGMQQALAADAAGRLLLDVLTEITVAPVAEEPWLDWQGFRVWLGRAFERQTFHPHGAQDRRVELLSLSQSGLARFNALIIGGATRKHLPGGATGAPFFNDAVRTELGLPPSQENQTQRFHQFRRLLHSAPEILVTWHSGEHEGQPSPWIELIESFHSMSYGTSLRDGELQFQAHSDQTLIAAHEPILPTPRTTLSAQIAPPLFPAKVSATDHQYLIDCPYKFFGAAILKLRAPEEVREILERGDYGERVHRCLHAFHIGVDGLPGPFELPMSPENRAVAIEFLQRIARAVFAADVEDNFQHRGLLHQWESRLPGYIDWQIKRAGDWRVAAAEQRVDTPYLDDHRCSGRLDRLDSNGAELAIVDYKTGHIPSNREITEGEAVQLAHYAIALANPAVTRVEYVDLGANKPKEKGTLEGEKLAGLANGIKARLSLVTEQIKEGSPLSAWGDQATCGRCNLAGICRRRVALSG